ncbi:PIN domain-containing protein [Tunicatimonas pelagia]|uniref:PIN domain-containing protein n=1 Tax=Tunicatimonas pelagia TaxID=931531 RepID=UPI0026660980|nr:PIN domain-containing protein [Tunicatimonas pelagia]WKN40737.1 PIN domain-containing protein [Tunicatimonas pelagia]
MLDACAVGDLAKRDANTLDHIKALSPSEVKISCITAHELRYGLFRNPQMKKTTREAVLGFLNDVEILPFTENEAMVAARIRANLQKKGQPIGA